MTETKGQDLGEWSRQWRAARATVMAASGWILALPALARLMRWHRRTVTWVQNVLGPISGLVGGRIDWIGVRRYGFSTEKAFLTGGLAGAAAPTFELTLRRLGWPQVLGSRPISEEIAHLSSRFPWPGSGVSFSVDSSRPWAPLSHVRDGNNGRTSGG
jgi:hypothetical protein